MLFGLFIIHFVAAWLFDEFWLTYRRVLRSLFPYLGCLCDHLLSLLVMELRVFLRNLSMPASYVVYLEMNESRCRDFVEEEKLWRRLVLEFNSVSINT